MLHTAAGKETGPQAPTGPARKECVRSRETPRTGRGASRLGLAPRREAGASAPQAPPAPRVPWGSPMLLFLRMGTGRFGGGRRLVRLLWALRLPSTASSAPAGGKSTRDRRPPAPRGWPCASCGSTSSPNSPGSGVLKKPSTSMGGVSRVQGWKPLHCPTHPSTPAKLPGGPHTSQRTCGGGAVGGHLPKRPGEEACSRPALPVRPKRTGPPQMVH